MNRVRAEEEEGKIKEKGMGEGGNEGRRDKAMWSREKTRIGR